MPTTKSNRVILMHLSFWGVYLSFFIFQVSSYQRPEIDWSRVLTVVTIQSSFAAFLGYLNYFYFLPRFLAEKNGWKHLAQFAVIFAIFITLRMYLERYVLDNFTGELKYLYTTRFIVHVITTNIFIVIFLAMLRFAVDWFEFESRKKSIENEKLTAELNFLKAQVNPHFLFNTLNNLYYLAYSQSPNTPEVIAKLSQMMRYMIYDSNYARVPLEKEIEYMENYISLERLRLNNTIPITFHVSGDVSNHSITPLIFITFLENAFKHGVSNNSSDAWVKLEILLDGKECRYTVENSKRKSVKPEAEEKSGIGLQNVKRRLDLSYPGSHALFVDDAKDHYKITLKLKLN